MQLELFNPTDNRPLPEIIASLHGFALAYHEDESGLDRNRWYLVQDWIAGIAQTKDAGGFWRKLIKRNPELRTQRRLPHRAANGKLYQMDHAQSESLMVMTQRMSLWTGIVAEIRGVPKPIRLSNWAGYVYLIGVQEIPNQFKIGIAKDVDERIYRLGTVMPATYQLIHCFGSDYPRRDEKALHNHFKAKRTIGEWFALSDADISFIKTFTGTDFLTGRAALSAQN